MEGAVLIGLELAIFFAGLYAIEYKRYSSAKHFAKKIPNAGESVIVTHDNVGKIPEIFALELRRLLETSKDGAVVVGNKEFLEFLRRNKESISDGNASDFYEADGGPNRDII
jgi:hypothetical protein